MLAQDVLYLEISLYIIVAYILVVSVYLFCVVCMLSDRSVVVFVWSYSSCDETTPV